MKKNEFLTPAPADYKWPRCPEADAYIEHVVKIFLEKHDFARRLNERMKTETSTLFTSWVDHLRIPASRLDLKALGKLGFELHKVRTPGGVKVFRHPYADLPRILVSASYKDLGCALMVDNIWHFQIAQGLSFPIQGTPFSTYREMCVPEGDVDLLVVERRGTQDIEVDKKDRSATYLRYFERWAVRQRRFKTQAEGMTATLSLAKETAKALGTGLASVIFLESERFYWQRRNRAAQIQKSRQDRLGLGWANHDHHTFRSSRSHFPMLINILMELGFKKRERYFAGAEAGWGAQVMEQPEAGTIIFADVDLAPEDVSVDFSKISLPDLAKPHTVGLWCALHGESILEAGMHHLEAQFDFDLLKNDLQERRVETMAPFSNFTFLRQAFTKAEMWKVPESRLSRLRDEGKISPEAFEQIRLNGAVGSHLENLQRKEGYKGFNQRAVSDIITAVNPESQALARRPGPGAA